MNILFLGLIYFIIYNKNFKLYLEIHNVVPDCYRMNLIDRTKEDLKNNTLAYAPISTQKAYIQAHILIKQILNKGLYKISIRG